MGKRKEFIGTVISSKMPKTIVVKVARLTKHPQYKRVIKSINTFKAHDENNLSRIGDVVRIQETRPLSKEKHFRLIQIVHKARVPEIQLKDESV